MPLRDVTLPHVREFIKALLGKQLAAKTIRNVILILKQMFKHAVQWGYLDSNPVQYVELPRGEEKEMDILTTAEIRRLLEPQAEPLKTLLLTAMLTGMRQGELFGLQWSDIDFDGHRIHVRRSLWHREFPRALRRAGLRHVRFHDLRHTYTSLLIAQGAHPKYIQAQLGHASIQTTLDRYGHLMPEIHQAEARKLDRLVFGDAGVPRPRDLAVVGIGRPAERVQNESRKHEGVSDVNR